MRKTKGLPREVEDLAMSTWTSIGSPLARGLIKAFLKGDWEYIAECKCSPRDYTDAQEYFLDVQAASLLRKCSFLPTSHNRKAEAILNWFRGERDCYKTNERLSPYIEGLTHPMCNEDVMLHIRGIREKIANVLGKAPHLDELHPKHGPGATYSDASVRATVADKMNSEPSFTRTAVWSLFDYFGTAWGREASKRGVYPVETRGNRFATAPKDATKDRPIAIEPSLNVFYQLALGGAIRRRLKRVGIDLDFGQEVHRRKACEASITGHLATLDLKNASDTVAINLVRLMLPHDWYSLLSELRSPFTRMTKIDMEQVGFTTDRGEPAWHKLEKFSSMGNGFTFELETLLFWAISDYAVQHTVVSPDREQTLVYGDDIICDSRASSDVISILRFFGFTLNEDKSFTSGPFRESCGGDFWEGRPVRPYFQKEPLDEPQQLIAALNQLRRVSFDLFGGLGKFGHAWFTLLGYLPSNVRRCRGPERFGDAVIHSSEDEWSWTSRSKNRLYAYVPVRHRKVSLRVFAEGTVLACGLYGVTVSTGFINPRDSVTGYAVRQLPAFGTDWLPAVHVRKGAAEPVSTPSPRTGPNYDKGVRVVRSIG